MKFTYSNDGDLTVFGSLTNQEPKEGEFGEKGCPSKLIIDL